MGTSIKDTFFNLDIGCGFNCQEGFKGLDRRKEVNPDFCHDIEDYPWPIEDNSCRTVLASHVIEHLNPKYLIDFFNEAWRILRPDGNLCIAVPYAGSFGAYQDPTHTRPGFNEATWLYFTPDHSLWQIYKPKPFSIVEGTLLFSHVGNMQVVLKALKPESEGITEKEIDAWMS